MNLLQAETLILRWPINTVQDCNKFTASEYYPYININKTQYFLSAAKISQFGEEQCINQ